MTFADDVRHVALRVVELLESNSVPYALMGGVAVPVWGVPRATYDIDVVLSLGEATLSSFIDLVTRNGFDVDSPHRAGFRDILHGMEKIRLETWTAESRRVEVDVFLVTTEYQKAAFSRRCRVRLGGREAWVMSAADLILHKLVAGRPKDHADVLNILSIQGVPDEEHLRGWADRLGVREALERAIADAELPGGAP